MRTMGSSGLSSERTRLPSIRCAGHVAYRVRPLTPLLRFTGATHRDAKRVERHSHVSSVSRWQAVPRIVYPTVCLFPHICSSIIVRSAAVRRLRRSYVAFRSGQPLEPQVSDDMTLGSFPPRTTSARGVPVPALHSQRVPSIPSLIARSTSQSFPSCFDSLPSISVAHLHSPAIMPLHYPPSCNALAVKYLYDHESN